MLFLSPLFLWGLLAAAVPIAIHLINRRRHKTVQWAAMQFLLKATRESRGKKKLRHFLILACRALGIAALAFAAARPVISGLIGWGGGKIDTVVLVLDRSASMEMKGRDGVDSRRQGIVTKVRDALVDLGNPRLVLIDSASMVPQEVPSPDVLAELSATAATSTAADFSALLNRAADFLADVSGRSEVWLASDLQSSNWKPNDERWVAARTILMALPIQPVIRVLSLNGSSASNSALSLLGTKRVDDKVLLDLELLRSDQARGALAVPLTMHLNGVATTEVLTIPGQQLRFQKKISLPSDTESGYGWVSIPSDGNAIDNFAYFAFGPARGTRSLVVSAPGESADYLALAAAPPGYGKLSASVSPLETAESAISPDLAAILWAAPLPSGSLADALQRYLSAGGQVMFLPPGSEGAQSFMDLTWSPLDEAPAGKFFILQDWNRNDGLLRDGLAGSPIAASGLKAIRRQLPVGDAAPLARWEDGEPALARRIVDRGTAWFLSSIPDYTWSNLGDADVLLPAVQRLIEAGEKRFDQAHLVSAGAEVLRTHRGERVRLDGGANSDPSNAAFDSGVYQLGDRVVAVNRPPEEDELEMITMDELSAALSGMTYTFFDQAGQADDAQLSKEVWRAFMVAVLMFLSAEAFLCLPKKTHPAVLPEKVHI